MPRPETQNDPAVVDALKAITGADTIRTVVDYTDDGKPRFAEGYKAFPTHYLAFNDLAQECHVPVERVAAELGKAAPAPAKAAK